jgi:hypothetical protein
MSYQLISSNVDYIRFHYTFAEIFTNVKLESEYRAKLLKDKDGNPLIEDYAMTDNENTGFEYHLKQGLYEIGKVVLKLTRGLTEALYVITSPAEVNILMVNKDYHNPNLLPILDKEMENMLTHYCLWNWYDHVSLPEISKTYLLRFQAAQIALSGLVFELRKPKLSSTGTPVVAALYPKFDVVTGVNINSDQDIVIDHSMNTTKYFVQAIQSDGTAIPGFDYAVTQRGSNYITVKLSESYTNVTLMFVGSTETLSTSQPKIQIVTQSIIAGNNSVNHTMGDDVYFVQAIQSDGVAIPGFDFMITTRASSYFSFTSGLAYSNVTFIIMGSG